MAAWKTRFLRIFLVISFLPTAAGIQFAPRETQVSPPMGAYAIDPGLAWNTFLGENDGTDYGLGIAVDEDGNTHVTGISNEAWGTPVRDYTGASDAFVGKLDASGNLIWNTFLGASAANDYGEDIAVDASGNVYVTGFTDASFGNGTWGDPVLPFAGQGDAFVAKLDSSGNLVWNTFLGSDVNDWGKGIVVTPDGNIYVSGWSSAAWGEPIVRDFTAVVDAFVAKLDSDGNLQWTGFFGGPGHDLGNGVTMDGNGHLLLAGFSTASDGNASWGNPVRDYATGGDAFVANIDASGNLVWNTFLGGDGYEHGYEVAVDRTGNVFVVGISNKAWENPVRDYAAGIDALVVSLDSSGNFLWNTFLGGNGFDYGYGIDVDGEGNLHITGSSTTAWGDPLRAYTALEDAFEAKLDPDGNLMSHMFLGGSGYDYGQDLDVDQNGIAYVTGSSTATWRTPVSDYTPPTDAFVAKLDSPPLVTSTSLKPTMDPGPSSFTVTFSEDVSNPPGSSSVDDVTNPGNYLLVEKGTNGSADTLSCAGGLVADDKQITIAGVAYEATTFTSTVTLSETLPAGNYRLFVCGTTSIVDLGNTALAGDGSISGTDYLFDFVVELNASPLVVSTSLNSKMDSGPKSFTVTFNEDVYDPSGNSNIDDATNPNNYLLIEKGANEVTDTLSCAGNVLTDDERLTVTNVTYNATNFTSTITLAEEIPAGKYRLFVCGTTSIVNLANIALAGDRVTPGTDYIFDFTVDTPTATVPVNTVSLPKTGFAPHVTTALPSQPAQKSYSSLEDLWLEIPSQGIKSSIVGVPKSDEGWDVTWLGNDIGWLHGTAFPSWAGNSVLTGHAYNSNGLPGPFADIKDLKYGDVIIVHLYGENYIFNVQSTRLTPPISKDFALQHLEDHSYLTLITCQGYNPLDDSYLFRRVVRAVLVAIE